MKTASIKIKVCGLKSVSEVKCASDYGARWYGMIFVKSSSRFLTYKQAETLINNTPSCIEPIAVTINPSYSKIKNLIELGFKYIQLHGDESTKFCLDLKNEYKLKIIKAISIRSLKDIVYANKFRNIVNWVLFDYKDDLLAGGTGKSFNWNLLSNKNLNFNWILSGGLDYNNVDKAIKKTGAKAVDVSSGLEIKKGIKSIELIKKFCNKVKST